MTPEQEIHLKMHEFYAQEARNQRSMMWETVKWFTPTLTVMWGFWFLNLLKYLDQFSLTVAAFSYFFPVVGALLSCYALRLLRMFYKTNLIYLTMFIKTEDELGFTVSKREIKKSYKEDDSVIYEEYRKDRFEKYQSAREFIETVAPSAEDLFWKNLTNYFKYRFKKKEKKQEDIKKPGTMYSWMAAVFFLFYFAFLFSALSVLVIMWVK